MFKTREFLTSATSIYTFAFHALIEGASSFFPGKKVKTPFAFRQNIESTGATEDSALTNKIISQSYFPLFNINDLLQII